MGARISGRGLVLLLVLAYSLLTTALAVVVTVSDSLEGRPEVVWLWNCGWPEGPEDFIRVVAFS